MKYLYIFFVFVLCFGIRVTAVSADTITQTYSLGFSAGVTGSVTVLNDKLYVSDSTNGRVKIIDLTNNSSSTVSVGTSPSVVLNDGISKVYVLNSGNSSVSTIDTSNGNSVSTYGLLAGQDPINMALVNNKIYVTFNGTSTTTVFDTVGLSTSTVRAINPGSNIFTYQSKVYVPGYSSSTIAVIDSADNSISYIRATGSVRAVTGLGSKIYAPVTGSVTVFDINNSYATSSISIGSGDTWAAASLDPKVYVTRYSQGKLTIIDTANGNSTTTVNVGSEPQVVTAFNNKIYVANFADNTVSVVDPSNGNALQTISVGAEPLILYGYGTKLYVANTAETTITVLETDTSAPIISGLSVVPSAVGATINWNTNEIATSTFQYGLTEALGMSTTTSGTSHAVVLNFLNVNSTYYYRIIMQDRAGNISSTTIATFQTTTPPPANDVAPLVQGGGQAGGFVMPIFNPVPVEAVNQNHQPNPVNPVLPPISPALVQQIANLPLVQKNAVQGIRHNEIQVVQMVLNLDKDIVVAQVGPGSPGKETTVFGPATKRAIQRFQLKHKIVASPNDPGFGVLGPKTRAKINQIIQAQKVQQQ